VFRYQIADREIFIDPFSRGRILTPERCHDLVSRIHGSRLAFSEHYLQPVTTRAILVRMLCNLRRIHVHRGDHERLLRVLNRLIQLNPSAIAEYRERALLHMSAGRLRAALCDFITYLSHGPDGADARAVHHQIDLIVTELSKSR
jgi:regulator of sirC expression with transglutaminase-like and TPR domain